MNRLNTLLTRLTPREQLLLAAGAALITLLGTWSLVWQPIKAQNALQEDRIARYLTLISLARDTQEGMTTQPTICGEQTALAPRITKSAETANIPLSRLDPEGTRLRITVATARYSDAMQWIAALEATACVTVTAVEMIRLPEPGQVSIRMTLEDA
ncbi:type II secretion system protein GspM [Phaeobacter italicus]|uniref:type II secretion system protein GspM n=1 Tax=Phaeobacter italicus TaxID=481446 RepID=UPI00248E8FDA|nr:type II secretion system protein GspM [Phaeobacter italicus]